ncbi:MAG: cytochrome c biogenesis protein ResB [Opitutales bacterium]
MSPILKAITSMKLTVTLLAFSMALVFFGTLDQVHYGIWHTQEKYFESFWVFWQYPEQWVGGDWLRFLHVPLPGGYLVGGLLLVNLVASHLSRFRLSWKKGGIFLIHAGLILLLVSELLTDVLAHEGQMRIEEGSRSNYYEDFRENELTFIDKSDPESDRVVAIPASRLAAAARRGEAITHEALPFAVDVLTYFPNSTIARRGNAPTTPPTPVDRGIGQPAGMPRDIVVLPRAVTYAENEVNTVSAFIRLTRPEGDLGTWLVSNIFDQRFETQRVQAGGRAWEIDLRFQRTYLPFHLALNDFRFDRYPGTEIPKNFSSEVVIINPEEHRDRTALIYMNHPLRYAGLTFYQASFDQATEAATVLQVVRNPGWLLPYVSVAMMGLGMCWQFGMHFFKFLGKRSNRSAANRVPAEAAAQAS